MAVDVEVLAQIAATGLAGMFAGAALYISGAQQPALLETDELAFQAPFFRRMYFYAARLQAPMAVGSGVSAVVVYVLQRDHLNGQTVPRLWLVSGCIMISIVPYTVVKMLALNSKLVDTKLCRKYGSVWMQAMLKRWGKLHAVRTGASMLAFGGMIVAMACSGMQQRRAPIHMSCTR